MKKKQPRYMKGINMEVSFKIPKKYQDAFGSLEEEYGLIDNCKYMLYFSHNYRYIDGSSSLPCRSKSEALDFLHNARLRNNDEI